MRLHQLLRSHRHHMFRSCQHAPFRWGLCLGFVLFMGLKYFFTVTTRTEPSLDKPLVGRQVQILVQGPLINRATPPPFNMSEWYKLDPVEERKLKALEKERKQMMKVKQDIEAIRQAGGMRAWSKLHRSQPVNRPVDAPLVVKNISLFFPPGRRDVYSGRHRGNRQWLA